MGKAPRECGVRPAKVTPVAFHPNAYVLAVGYEDGCILLVRLTDASELLVRPDGSRTAASRPSPGTAPGKRLAFGCEDGQAGILTLPALSRRCASGSSAAAFDADAAAGRDRAREGVGRARRSGSPPARPSRSTRSPAPIRAAPASRP